MDSHRLLSFRTVMFLSVIVCVFFIPSSSAWVSGYDYRVPIEFNNTGNNLTSTKHNFTFDTATEIAAGNMTYANGSDFIITNATDVLQEFWNETAFNLSDTLFWLNASSLGNVSNTTYYGYYGNSSRTTSSANISKTFLFGDDYESGNLNQWDQPAGGTITSTVGEVYVGTYAVKTNQGVNNFYENIDNFGDTLVIETNLKCPTTNTFFGTIEGNTFGSGSRLIGNKSTPAEYHIYDGSFHNSGVAFIGYQKVKLIINSTAVKYYGSDSLLYTGTYATNPEKLVLYSYSGDWIYMDNVFVYEYVETEPTWSTGAVEQESTPTIELLSQIPSTICQNCTGNISILYGISHSSTGLNNTSISFIYRDYDHDLGDSNHSIRPPINDLASEWNFDGRILRGANRNESLNFENNATITGGDTYTWSGLDENNSEMYIVPVNSTYTKVYINSTVHRVMPQMHYIDRSELQEAPKTTIAIHKTQNVLVKFWNFEIFKGNTDFLGVGYTDTALNTNPALHPSDANPINVYYISSGYDPSTGSDPLASGYAVYMLSLNASEWIDHVYSPCANCSYARGFIDNNLLESYINTTNISYLYYTSNTASSKAFYINVTNIASPSNVSFADTNVLWAGDTVLSQQSYTPSIWFAFMKLNMSFDHKLYVADNNNNWANSTMNRTNITTGLFPPTKPSFYAFHNGFQDFDMNGTYHDTIKIQVSAGSDPDGGVVTHNITLHYGVNNTYIATINGSVVAEDGVYTNITFNTTPYYSDDVNYTLRVVATDDEGESVTVWLGVNFSLDGSPRIITYSPETPVSSAEGENQTFSITTNLPGNVTWYLDSVEVFNETDVNSSSYSNENASLGSHNVTVITTNTNGSNSQKWDWTVRTKLWSLIEDSVTWGISVAQYLVSSIGIVIVTAFSLVCILILMMLIGAALSVTKIIYR